WHAGAEKNRNTNRKMLSIIDDLIKSNTCAKQLLEIYSKMYYTSQVKPGHPLDLKDTNISSLWQQIKKQFEAKPQQICNEVMCIHKEQTISKNTPIEKDDEEACPDIDEDTCASNIQQCRPVLKQILFHLSQKSGWSFSVLMSGQDPENPGNYYAIVYLHTGKNNHGLNFAESYVPFNSTIVQAYTQFLGSQYSKSLLL
ncbi:hypothetical protein V8B97DRAFT_1877638, partial [Scleroderma yunnanense]